LIYLCISLTDADKVTIISIPPENVTIFYGGGGWNTPSIFNKWASSNILFLVAYIHFFNIFQ